MKNLVFILGVLYVIPSMLQSQGIHAEKMIISIAKDWDSSEGMLFLYDNANDTWGKAIFSASVHYGSEGMAWGTGLHPAQNNFKAKQEGDKRSPAGIFSIGTLYGLDPVPPPGVRYPYRQISERTRCIDDADSPFYNRIIEEDSTKKQWTSAEHMARVRPDYKYVLVLDHNSDLEAGNGSCIFLHINNIPTTGCTSMDESTMIELLRWLDPEARTVIVQLPYSEYLRLRSDWDLPVIPENIP